MRVLLDACVLYPTVMREVLLAVAARGLFTPLWSARILEEWARATARLGPAAEAQARGEIAVVAARWPAAIVPPAPGRERRLWLPDPADIHVLAAAVEGHADAVCTTNAKDFPRQILAAEGLERRDPDQLLTALHDGGDAAAVSAAVAEVHATAERLSGERLALRGLLKRARLPKLGKRLG